METLAERTTRRLREFAEAQPRGFKIALARRLGVSAAAITPYVGQEARQMPLEMLEALSELVSVPVGELIAKEGSTYRELNADEAALLRALRRWPPNVTRSLCAFVAFFADEEPAAAQTRALHELWRQTDDPMRRNKIFAVALWIAEGLLTPDLQAIFDSQTIAEAKAGTTGRKKTTP